MRGLRRAEAKLKAFGQSVKSVGQSMVRVGALVAAPFAASTVVFASYEQQMARVRALTKANEQDFARLGARAKELGASTVFSAAQAAEAMGVFALAGYDVESILKSVGPTLELAAAGQIEIAEAADIAAKIMSGMGIAVEDLGNTMDVLTKAMTTANTDIMMLGEAFKFVGPLSKTAGQSLEGVTAAIQLLSNAGIQGEMAGTSLRGMLLALTSPSKEAKKTLDQLGVSVADAQGNVKPLVQIIGQMERAMARMGSAQKLDILGTIFGARPASGVAVLIDQGAGQLAEAEAALQDATGTAAGIAATQLDTLTGSAKLLLSALQGLAIEIAEGIAPSLRTWGERMVLVTNAISTLVKNNRALVIAIFKGTSIVIGAGTALIALGVSAKIAGAALGGLRVALAATSVATVGLNAAILALKATVAVLLGAIALFTSPLGLVVAALAAAGFAFVRFTETGQQSIRSLQSTVRSGFGRILDTGRQAFESLKETALTAFGGIKDALMAGDIQQAGKILWLALRLEWTKGVAFLRDQWDGLLIALLDRTGAVTIPLAQFFVDAFATIRTALVETTTFMTQAWVVTLNFMKSAWIDMTTTLVTTWNSITGFFAASFAAIAKLFEPVVNAISVGFNFIKAIVGQVISDVTHIVSVGFNFIKATIGQVINDAIAIWQWFGDTFGVVAKGIGLIAQVVFGGIALAIGGIIEVLKTAIGWMGQLLKAVGKFLGINAALDEFNKVQQETADKNREVRESAGQRKQSLQSGLSEQLAEIEADRQRKLQSIEEQRQAGQGAIERLPETLEQGRQQRLDVNQTEIQRLKDELAAAIEEAKPKAVLDAIAGEEGVAGKPPKGLTFTPEGLDAGLEKSEAKTDVKGSFSAAALRGLGASDSAGERTAEATEKTAEELAKLNNRARQGRLVFGA